MTTLQLLQAATVLILYCVLCHRCLRRSAPSQGADHASALIGFASQSGHAQQLAEQQAKQLSGRTSVLPLNQIRTDDLCRVKLALFVVSTYGEGEPPDNGLLFVRRLINARPEQDLTQLHFAVLALGDSSYQHFCAFGLSLESALTNRGARPIFAAITVDRLENNSIEQWQQQLIAAGISDSENTPLASPLTAAANAWQLSERHHLNPGSQGGPIYQLRFRCRADAMPAWQAGDIAVLPLPFSVKEEGDQSYREYSIASIPEDGTLDLVIRQVHKDGGELGAGSGWLSSTLATGDTVNLYIRSNPAFHSPPVSQDMILIGNGTGIAGLRAHLKQRQASSGKPARSGRNWLIFGERNRAVDSLFSADIQHWQTCGKLDRVDRVFSRDPQGGGYVQDLMRERWDKVADWLKQGAVLYICGSAEGMAPALHRLLLDKLGEEQLEALTLEGRYRRDVY